MSWRNVIASVANMTPAYGYLWPDQAGGKIGVRKVDVELAELRAERDRLRDELTAMQDDRHHWRSELEGQLAEVTDERDRLRPVVDAARAEREAFRAMRLIPHGQPHEAWVSAHRVLHTAIDVSNGESVVTPELMALQLGAIAALEDDEGPDRSALWAGRVDGE